MRTTIDLADDWEEAAKVLGTEGKTATVNAAISRVIAEHRRGEAASILASVELDLDDETMREAWA
ncbi:type II toxin-antitoxin system VapB family antitoxin [Nocardia sp. 2]|uniref:Type II toxin-antitoxin system VapB family antitoxin n=1 Tax=Nocardia acididurans TaxID=2802282 RepID=A0ABS1MA60_9NOCA|nr:type II toxin-antitoxin system VapB family antitoxin [Nocardia acididurans]MBL1077444.1 type II toxin-antitoxin system VapB family antitoxin [Nocardia acididurans]